MFLHWQDNDKKQHVCNGTPFTVGENLPALEFQHQSLHVPIKSATFVQRLLNVFKTFRTSGVCTTTQRVPTSCTTITQRVLKSWTFGPRWVVVVSLGSLRVVAKDGTNNNYITVNTKCWRANRKSQFLHPLKTWRQNMAVTIHLNPLHTGDSSAVIYWTSPFAIFGVSVYFVAFILFLMENLVSKQGRP